jgi:hypothetical protein
MKRKGFMVLAVLVLIAGAFGLAHSNSGYWADFKAAYSTSPLTNPPLTNSAGQNCLVCHAGWPTTTARGSTINAFANAYIDNSYVFDATLEGLD